MAKKEINYLPVGSVVLMETCENRILICGRMVKKPGGNEIFDYVGYRFPHGYQKPQDEIFFMHSQIEMVFFLGFQDMEELVYREVLQNIAETAVEDGEVSAGEARREEADNETSKIW